MDNLEAVWLVATIIIGIAGAAIYVVSQIRRTRTEELAELAATRGHRINDLESTVLRLEGRINKLEGAYEALMTLKIESIADAVVARLVGDHDIGLL